MSGSFLLKNTKLCAVVSRQRLQRVRERVGSRTTTRSIIVAKSKGPTRASQAAADNNSVEVKSSQFQGVLSGEHDIISETTSVVQGPIISSTAASTSARRPAPPSRHPLPALGAAGNPPPPSVLLEPREFEGG